MINLSAGIGLTGTRTAATLSRLRALATSSQSFARRGPSTFADALTRTTAGGIGSALATLAAQMPAARQTSVIGQVFATPFSVAATQPIVPIPVNALAQDTTSMRMMEKSQHWYASDPVDDAYWAKQPPAVQQLREIDDPDARKELATQLAAQGYSIDVPIMVWGFDAGKTTALRQQYGYTWVPSALQKPIELAPGLTMPGMDPYDPNNPPPGSILV